MKKNGFSISFGPTYSPGSNGIIERAEILAKKMKFKDQSDLYLRLKRLLHPKLMGNLFKVALAYKCKNKNFNGFN